jgi:transcriptional regulator with XRE-family HTH domain
MLKNFRENMRNKRLENKISQKKLAQIIGTSLSTIKNYENGTTIPTGDAMVMIAATLGLSLDEMVGDNKKNKERILAGRILEEVENNGLYSVILDDINFMALIYKKVRFEMEEETVSDEVLDSIFGGKTKLSRNEKISYIKSKNKDEIANYVFSKEKEIKENLDKYDLPFGYLYKGELHKETIEQIFNDDRFKYDEED